MTTKVAYLSVPFVGGTYTRFVILRPLLARYGFDFQCIHCDPSGAQGLHVEEVAPGMERWVLPADVRAAVPLAVERLQAEEYKLVVALPLGNLIHMLLALHLPDNRASLLLVPSMTRTTYEFTQFMAPYADGVIAVSERVRNDLVSRFGIPGSKVHAIFNGVDTSVFKPGHATTPSGNERLRILYCGRLADLSKGVLWIPDIARETLKRKVPCRFDVVGSGSDLDRLRAKIRRENLEEAVQVRGPVPREQCPSLMQQYDCLCLPSRVDACPNTLLEAMASGCVPVASHISGSVGAIIEDGISGHLVPIGDVREFARRFEMLHGNRRQLALMRQAALDRVNSKFTVEAMAASYANVFRTAIKRPDHAERRPCTRVAVPHVFRRRLRSRLPLRVKQFMRKWMARRGDIG